MAAIPNLAAALVAAAAALAPATAAAGVVSTVPIPEPGTLGMFAAGIGAAVVVLRLWRR